MVSVWVVCVKIDKKFDNLVFRGSKWLNQRLKLQLIQDNLVRIDVVVVFQHLLVLKVADPIIEVFELSLKLQNLVF